MEGLHRAYLDRQVTLFAPTNDALRAFGGRRVLSQFQLSYLEIVNCHSSDDIDLLSLNHRVR